MLLFESYQPPACIATQSGAAKALRRLDATAAVIPETSEEVMKMANLVRRENREVSRGRTPDVGLEVFRSWDPLRMMESLLRWDPFREGGFMPRAVETFVPRFDVKEVKDGYVLRADLPGVKENEIDISLSGNVLTVSGRREEEHREEGEQYYSMERSYGQFARSFSLPEGVDTEGVRAELKEGVLSIHIGKKPEVQPKKIAIGSGGGGAKA